MQPTNHNAYQEIRLISALLCCALLALHFYYYCYAAFSAWHLTAPIADRLATNLVGSGLLRHRATPKLIALVALGLTLIGRPYRGGASIAAASFSFLLQASAYTSAAISSFWSRLIQVPSPLRTSASPSPGFGRFTPGQPRSPGSCTGTFRRMSSTVSTNPSPNRSAASPALTPSI